MLTPLILFLGLTVATAVIAYWSDNLGKKLGKKRVTLMGLRPRTTATILTISSSWAIMLFTLAVLLSVVKPLRHALFRYDHDIAAAKSTLKDTQNWLSQSQNSLARSDQQLHRSNHQLSQSNQQLSQSQANLKAAQSNVKTAQSAAKTALTGAKQARSGERQAQAGAEQARKRAETARRSAETAQRSEETAQRLEEQAQDALKASRVSLNEVRASFNATQNSLVLTQAQLGTVQARLRAAQASYQRASAATSRVGGAVLRLGPQVLTLSREINGLTRQRNLLQQQIDTLLLTTVQLAGGDVKIPIGKTFAAQIIPARESQARIEARLRAILQQGQSAFAASDETKPLYDQGARLILFPLPKKSADNTPVLHALAQAIASNGATTSVRLVAAVNSTSEEKQIAVSFIAVPVAVAFRAGETLASATVEPSGGDAGIFRALNDLIEAGRENAVRRNVNPPLSPDEPTFYADGTSVGLFEALRRIEASGRAQRVQIVAAEELSTVEPLRVRFEVEAPPLS